jgi:hypothetical protein
LDTHNAIRTAVDLGRLTGIDSLIGLTSIADSNEADREDETLIVALACEVAHAHHVSATFQKSWVRLSGKTEVWCAAGSTGAQQRRY